MQRADCSACDRPPGHYRARAQEQRWSRLLGAVSFEERGRPESNRRLCERFPRRLTPWATPPRPHSGHRKCSPGTQTVIMLNMGDSCVGVKPRHGVSCLASPATVGRRRELPARCRSRRAPGRSARRSAPVAVASGSSSLTALSRGRAPVDRLGHCRREGAERSHEPPMCADSSTVGAHSTCSQPSGQVTSPGRQNSSRSARSVALTHSTRTGEQHVTHSGRRSTSISPRG